MLTPQRPPCRCLPRPFVAGAPTRLPHSPRPRSATSRAQSQSHPQRRRPVPRPPPHAPPRRLPLWPPPRRREPPFRRFEAPPTPRPPQAPPLAQRALRGFRNDRSADRGPRVVRRHVFKARVVPSRAPGGPRALGRQAHARPLPRNKVQHRCRGRELPVAGFGRRAPLAVGSLVLGECARRLCLSIYVGDYVDCRLVDCVVLE